MALSFLAFLLIVVGVIGGGILIAVIIGTTQSANTKSKDKKLRKQLEQQALQEDALMQNADNPYMKRFEEQE